MAIYSLFALSYLGHFFALEDAKRPKSKISTNDQAVLKKQNDYEKMDFGR